MGRRIRYSHKSRRMFLALLPFAFLASVNAHGGMMWPPTWQDGVGRPIDAITNDSVLSLPLVKDPHGGRSVVNIKTWLTDQAYTGGVGDEFKGIGPVTNDNNKNLPRGDRCRGNCVKYRNPWAAPGQAPSLGGGCGIFGGNPWGCPAGKDTRPPGSVCGQNMPSGGRTEITEECFTKNVLEFATNFTMIKPMNKNGKGEWEKFEQIDLSEGTYPEGSVWRPVGKYLKSATTLRKDSVVVPSTLAPGDYVLGWRWDGSGGNQVWVSCASMRLVAAPSVRAITGYEKRDYHNEEEDTPLYTDEEYDELEGAFEY